MGNDNYHTARLTALTLALLPLSFTTALATEHDDSFALSPEQLFGATVVSVSKTSQKLMDAPAAIYVLTSEDIMRSGATSIPQALRLVPGVQVARTHAGGWAISVRGFNSGLANKLLVLIDGREVYDALFSGVYWDVQDTALEDIERIEVIRGPGATLWGANAVNGVINILTKHAKDTQGGMVSVIAGNQDKAITTGRFGGALGENAHYRAYAKYVYRDEARTLSDAGAKDHQQAIRGGFRSDWQAGGGKDTFTLQGDMVRNDTGQFRVSPALVLNIEQIHATGWNVLGRWTRELSNNSRLSMQSYLDYTYRDQLLIADKRLSFDNEVQYEFSPLEGHQTVVGGRYRVSNDTLTPSAFITFGNATRNDQLFSGFVQDKITLAPENWYLTIGSKFEHNDYSGFEMQPNARLQWHINPEQMAWASVARAVRTPSRLEHDLNLVFIAPAFFVSRPNPAFDSEELMAYELGYRHQLSPELQFDLATFYNEYSKLAVVNIIPGPFPITTTTANGMTGETYGGEAVASWRITDDVNLSTSYSLVAMALHAIPTAVNANAAEYQSPRHQFTFRSQWDIRNDLFLDAMLSHTDDRANYRVEDYWGLDLGLGWQITEGLQFNLVGQDLLASTHREFTPLSDPFTPPAKIGRSFYGKFTWRF